MRIISFNVNGIRAIAQKHILEQLIQEQKPDILTLQEIKTQSIGDLDFLKPFFNHIYINTAVKKGYSGTALLTNVEPEWIAHNFEYYDLATEKTWSQEGRAITAKFQTHIVVTVYTPNAKPGLVRIQERLEWEECLRMYLWALEEFNLPIILCGDLNVAPEAIDIHNKQPKNTPGASVEERTAFQLLTQTYTDSFRHLYPDKQEFSWWSNFANSRDRNKGWRIDLILVNTTHKDKIEIAEILRDYKGSDHCPVLLQIKSATTANL
jgi:exodeoxyribonuclease-3